jgi:hypothetical protein
MTPIEITIDMTPEQFVAKGEELRVHQGIVLGGCEGTVSKFGITANYTYDGTTLKTEITSKPAFVTEHYVEQVFRSWLTS